MGRVIQDHRPSLSDCVALSQNAYDASRQPNQQDIVAPLDNWQVHATSTTVVHENYYGVIYINHETNHIVLANKGTSNLGDKLIDAWAVAFNFDHRVLEGLKRFVRIALQLAHTLSYSITFTGHSLGGWYAEITACLAVKVFTNFVNSETMHINVVSFDSPGSKSACNRYLTPLERASDFFNKYDVQSILFYPNPVNGTRSHIGKLYHAMIPVEANRFTQNHSLDAMRDYVYRYDVHQIPNVEGDVIHPARIIRFQLAEGNLIPMRKWPGSIGSRVAYGRRGQLRNLQFRDRDDPVRVIYTQNFQRKAYIVNQGDHQIEVPYGGNASESCHFHVALAAFLRDFFFYRTDEKHNIITLIEGVEESLCFELMSYQLYNETDESYTSLKEFPELTDWKGIIRTRFMSIQSFRQALSSVLSRMDDDQIDELIGQ